MACRIGQTLRADRNGRINRQTSASKPPTRRYKTSARLSKTRRTPNLEQTQKAVESLIRLSRQQRELLKQQQNLLEEQSGLIEFLFRE